MQSAGPQLQQEAAPHIRRVVSFVALLTPQAGKVARQASRSPWVSQALGLLPSSLRTLGQLPAASDSAPGGLLEISLSWSMTLCPEPTAAPPVPLPAPRRRPRVSELGRGRWLPAAVPALTPVAPPKAPGGLLGGQPPTGRPQPCARPPPPHPSLPRACLAPLSLCKWGPVWLPP